MEEGKKVDELIKERNKGYSLIMKSTKELIDMGVKLGQMTEEGETSFNIPDNYLPNFAFNLEEYEWEAEYEDGSKIRQYDIDKEHHFGDIDQSKLKRITYYSNFEYPTDNLEKRVIVSLDWKTGVFTFMNGLVDMKERGELSKERKPRKLILYKRVQQGQTSELSSGGSKPTGDIYFYKRYYLGYETEDNQKIIICLYPNMQIKIV